MDVSLLDVAIVSNASVVDIVCVVNREGNDESPLQEMFSRTSATRWVFVFNTINTNSYEITHLCL